MLGFEPLQEQHSDKNLAEVLNNVIIKHELSDWLITITTDNASNNKTMHSELMNILED